VVVGLFGFLQGVLLGVVAAIVLFVVKYSRVNVVKHALAGTHHLSHVDRPPDCRAALREQGEGIFILKLHGFIFFGTANGLYTRIKQRTVDAALPPLRFVALDFREVSGLDTSAVISLIKMRQLAAKSGFVILLSHLGGHDRKMMEREELIRTDDANLKVFADLDHALEWCEDQVLLEAGVDQCGLDLTLQHHLEALFPGSFDYAKLAPYLERMEIPAGKYFIEQGDPSDDMYFIESGRVAVHVKLATGEVLRLRKMGAGNVVGEMGLYLDKKRSASVIADEDAVVYRLSRESLWDMEEEHPATAAAFHQFMVRMLSQRVLDTDETLKVLMA
jgi:SulP family sulfate permease